ncbi:M23 family metallopeptidase [Mesorhizobium sp. LHD-90]|uniref:M23 family metallopeptidase n=1 Tax=Mesorhizobium sp. LHD-90 TaxID=3071414 RepID=UPI0027DFF8DF|nr:M23 family metallopeptidase [Mesorhizobium sp. LHD-90]MDQ6437155.1 M23 family metallopeptidase [Mesorhizobium sp. LHD-90]
MAAHSTVFGKRREPHTVIIARGNSIKHFTVRPWMAALAGSVVAAVTLGYFAATSYLVFRDDLIGAAIARQARMQHAYEDRISALRAQVDRITSRQLLDQQLMETKVTELLARQSKLSERHSRMGPILEKANASAEEAAGAQPAPRPGDRADAGTPALSYARAANAATFPLWSTRDGNDPSESAADRADKLFVSINQSLRTIETEQIAKISTLADDAYQAADQISEILEDAGLPVDADFGKSDMGGPLIAIDNVQAFDTKVRELDVALDLLDQVKKQAKSLPIANPAPGRSISSTFGMRKDPILGTPALHSGMDFRAPTGTPATATAAGVVTIAGWNGGYGRLVEIDHGNGLATRFAHLSRIGVKEGQRVRLGDVIGLTGNSGRSTGPHMHYEIRRGGHAVDPLRFIKVGKKLSQLL